MKNKNAYLKQLLWSAIFSVLFLSCDEKADPNPKSDFITPILAQTFQEIILSPLNKGLCTGRIYDEIILNPAIVDDFKALGVQWVRIEFEEFSYLPVGISLDDPRVIANINKFSTIVDLLHSKNIKVLALIGYNSTPYQEVPTSMEAIQRYAEMLRWHLEKYELDAVEIWNEPGVYGFSPKENLKWYGSMLIYVYDHLKPSFPDVPFVAPATANAEAGDWIGRHYYQEPDRIEGENSIFNTLEMRTWRTLHNNKLPLDIISWHAYGSDLATPDENFYFGRNFNTYYQEIIDYKDLDGRSIVGDYPIWFTEYGWSSHRVGEIGQQNNFKAIMNDFEKISAVKNVFWYDYKDDENLPGTEGNTHGLIKNSTNGFTKKPAYYSYMAFATGVGLSKTANGYVANEVMTKKYADLGGHTALGTPVYSQISNTNKGYVYDLGSSMSVQHFLESGNPVAIVYNKTMQKAFLISADFYSYFMAAFDRLGAPESDGQTTGGILVQLFQNGSLKLENGQVLFYPNT